MQYQHIDQRIRRLGALIGAVTCALLAILAALLFRPYQYRAMLPLIFIIVLIMVSQRCGAAAGILGSLAPALIFSHFFYSAGLKTLDATLRTNLSWMLLLGIPASYFVAATQNSQIDDQR